MIVKIWPIKADYSGQKGKVGGIKGLKNAADYVMDQEKVIAATDDYADYMSDELYDVLEKSRINVEPDFHRVVSYMANEDKTQAKYISTYLCSNSDPVQDFRVAAHMLATKSGYKINPESGAMAYHLVQSFPEGLEISNDEVHECGQELVRRLEKYQALICSHVHPVINEEGEVHGRCKHNHILLNAYMHPDFYDRERGGPGKYNDCKDSYHQLQIYNDEIAIEHGLPIIRDPDMKRKYSWTERNHINKGTSWKERVRLDIETYRRVARDWEEFEKIMNAQGYSINKKKHITYTTPDGHMVRADTLGRQYTKEELNLYWAIRDHAKDVIKQDLQINEEPILSDFVYHYHGKLSVKIPLGAQFKENRQFAFVPLSKDIRADEEALRSYMAMDEIYDICNEDGQSVKVASGIEILRSIEDLKDEARMKYREHTRMEEDAIREERRRREEEKEERKQKYFNKNFQNSRSGTIYKCEFYDENGRRRTLIELMFVLALVILDKESYLWVPKGEVTKEQANEPFFAETSKKLQEMLKIIDIARQEELETPDQLKKRLDIVGADLNRSKKAYESTSRAAARMEPLARALETYSKTRNLAESIQAMPDGEEKNALIEKYADVIKDYKAAKHVMYINRTTDEAAIEDFQQRYEQIKKDVSELEVRVKEKNGQYSRLKKVEYNLQLAQNPQYVYGVSYPGVGYQFGQQEPEQHEEQANQQDEIQAKLDQMIADANRNQSEKKRETNRKEPSPADKQIP